MGRNSIIWPMLEYQQQQRQLAAQGTAGQVLMNYPWAQGGQQPQPPMPGQPSQPSGGQYGASSDPNSDNYQEQGKPQTAAFTPSRGVSGPPDWNTKTAALQPSQGVDDKTLGIFKQLEGSGEGAISPAGAEGTYQIMPNTARQYGLDPNKLLDPEYNKQAAQKIITDLKGRYKGDLPAMAVAYNAGPGVANKWLASGRNNAVLPAETQKYLGHLDQIQKGGMSGATPASANMTRMLAPSAPAMTLQGIVDTAKRINPNISGQELFATVSALSPLMSKETQDQFRMVQLQMREMQLEQSQQRINDTEQYREQEMGFKREKEAAKEELDAEKLELQKAKLGLAAQKWEDQKKEFNQKFDQAEEKIQNAKTMQEKSFALRQAYEAKNQALRAKAEAIQAASNIADPDLRKQFMDQANSDYDEAEARYKKLSDAYKSERDNVPSASGGTVESRKSEPVGQPKSVDKQTTINQAKAAIAAGKDPEKVKAKLKELGIDPSALEGSDNAEVNTNPGP